MCSDWPGQRPVPAKVSGYDCLFCSSGVGAVVVILAALDQALSIVFVVHSTVVVEDVTSS